jgi:dipeptidyl aminopeptidase/acylaminoacyl peptidase
MVKKSIFWNGIFLAALFAAGTGQAGDGNRRPLSVHDIMKMKKIQHAVLSEEGRWVAFSAYPGRGDPEVIVRSIDSKTRYQIPCASNPLISGDSRWVAAARVPGPPHSGEANRKEEQPARGMVLLNTVTGDTVSVPDVERYTFSRDGRWLAVQHSPARPKPEEAGNNGRGSREKELDPESKGSRGRTLVLWDLDENRKTTFPWVGTFAFDSTSHYLAFSVADSTGLGNGLFTVDLTLDTLMEKIVDFQKNTRYGQLCWNNRRHVLAFITAQGGKEAGDSSRVLVWDPAREEVVGAVESRFLEGDYYIPFQNDLTWTDDGQRLFFGFRPSGERKEEPAAEATKEADTDSLLYDTSAILKEREVDVWHWNDDFIIPHQKKRWPRTRRKTFMAVYYLAGGKTVRLAGEEVPDVRISQNHRFVLGSSDIPYRKEVTWEGNFSDYYLIHMEDGYRQKILTRSRGPIYLSPLGNFVLHYRDGHWHLYDCQTTRTRNLTGGMSIPFHNEDHDYPSPPPGYGIAGWIENDEAVLIYDKYDIWQFSTRTDQVISLTRGEGRAQNYTFRVQTLNPEQRFFGSRERLILTGFHHRLKNTGFFSCRAGRDGVDREMLEEKTFRFKAKALRGEAILYTRESYEEFPDLWVSDIYFGSPRRISRINPQIGEFAWGRAELIEWNSLDGIPLQGVLIKPGNYEPGRRYPVLVYFYRLFSQRLHEFNETMINHRPCFPFYASNGYAVFLPDIRFEVGQPGFSAFKCLVPGVQRLIDLGIADPEAVALHGHSWSGYQTAFVITQTDIFACAITGAPVSNMTSAYSGIRWGSGRARQFQYERGQSRIGGSLWEVPEHYIENSPVFFADRIHTPLMIMFGDEDEAVPWTQGIEFYLAMRRLGKPCVFLQYRGEPHHPQKFANKLDYTLRMKAYLDYYLKGAEPESWILGGESYRGK